MALTFMKLYQILLALSKEGREAVLPNQILMVLFIPHGQKTCSNITCHNFSGDFYASLFNYE